MRPLDWIKNLPDHWEAKPLRSISRYSASNVDKLSSDNEIRIRLCNYTDVYYNEFITNGLGFMSATATSDEVEKFGLAVGDVIITKDSEAWDDIGVPALVREAANDLVCGYHLALLRAHKKIMDGAFLFRCLQAKPVQSQFALSARGVTRFGLSRTEIGATILPVPSLPQQRAIADYLDRETAQIDELVEAKERLLYLLAEKRSALIAHAVASGIDAGALTRESKASADNEDCARVERRHGMRRAAEYVWPVKRLRFLTRRYLSEHRKEILARAKQVTFLPMENIGEQGEIDLSITRDIDDIRSGYTQFFDDDVLVAKITPCFENGKGALVRGTLSGVGFGTTELHVLTPGEELNARFLYYVTASNRFRNLGEAAMFGAAGQKRVPEDFIRDYEVPVPPLARQRAIADYLDRETARLDELAARTRDTVVLLKERRGALVAAAVTGQIDVGNAA